MTNPQTITLEEAWWGEYPAQEELIWNYVGQMDFENEEFPVIEIDPVDLVGEDREGDTIWSQYVDHAEDWQKELVDYYRQHIDEIRNTYIIVDGSSGNIVDGNHRLIAMALEGVRNAKAVDVG